MSIVEQNLARLRKIKAEITGRLDSKKQKDSSFESKYWEHVGEYFKGALSQKELAETVRKELPGPEGGV
jgi:hypothetical protein